MDKYFTFIKAHEKILLIVLGFVLLFGVGNRVVDQIVTRDKVKANVAQSVLQNQINQNKELASQLTQIEGQYQALIASITHQNEVLGQSIKNRDEAAKNRINANNALSQPELVTRWKQLVPTINPLVTSTNVQLTTSDVRDTVNSLEQVPVLQADLADQKKVSENQTLVINQANNLIDGQKQQIAGLQNQIVDKDKACTAQVNEAKAKGKKSFFTGVKVGFVTGFASGFGLGHLIH